MSKYPDRGTGNDFGFKMGNGSQDRAQIQQDGSEFGDGRSVAARLSAWGRRFLAGRPKEGVPVIGGHAEDIGVRAGLIKEDW